MVASPFVEHRIKGTQASGVVACGLHMDSVVVVSRL